MRSRTHCQSCRACKQAVLRLLRRAAGQVVEQYDLGLPARLPNYRGSPFFDSLSLIHDALREHRGHARFVSRKRLRGVDYYLVEHKVAVEFDESQHFTRPRRIALESYPAGMALGFDRSKWIELCRTLDRRDDRPIYRDEQRAWLDTLRDFSAGLRGDRPTIRLYAGDRKWCDLDPDRAADVEFFTRTHLPFLVETP